MRLIDADMLTSELYGIYNLNLENADRLETSIYLDGFARAIKTVNSAPTVMQWVSTEDRLPDNPRAVLCWMKDKGIYLGYYNNLDEYKCFMPWPYIDEDISRATHWMELPKPPT